MTLRDVEQPPSDAANNAAVPSFIRIRGSLSLLSAAVARNQRWRLLRARILSDHVHLRDPLRRRQHRSDAGAEQADVRAGTFVQLRFHKARVRVAPQFARALYNFMTC